MNNLYPDRNFVQTQTSLRFTRSYGICVRAEIGDMDHVDTLDLSFKSLLSSFFYINPACR